jgi:protein-export membrane protein SecD
VLFTVPGNLAKKIKIPIPEILQKPFKTGLDLRGGAHLLYEADLSKVKREDRESSMNGLRDVIERRVNYTGTKEPVVQVEKAGQKYRLIVELAGVSDIKKAIEMIGQTPTLDFREEMSLEQRQNIVKMLPESEIQRYIQDIEKQTGKKITKDQVAEYLPLYKQTKLTGKYLKTAKLDFDQNSYKPIVSLEFNKEGAKIFKELTKKNIGKKLAIYIDNQIISSPTVQEEITGGKAQITGEFTTEEAKKLARNLSAGALPAPIKLISQQTIGASLGQSSVKKSINAGTIGFLLVILFMILVYKFSGFLSDIALLFYSVILLALFKLMPVTLNLSGIAGFILSLGMAVDANVLVFERLKEEFGEGIDFDTAVDNAFHRAWPAIRDGHLTTLITCVILYMFASGFVRGFALTLALGNLCSMFSAMIVTKTLVKAFRDTKLSKIQKIWTR